MDRLPLRVMFIDQEAEWKATEDYVDSVMRHPDVLPMWFQMPIKMSNATSMFEKWAYCWEDEAEGDWIHPKSDISIHENTFGTMSFLDLFAAILKDTFPGEKACYIAGVRTQESPTRFIGLTSEATYKHVTWGKKLDKVVGQYTFYPAGS